MSTLNTCTSSTRPASPSDGDMLYETDTYKTIISYNSVWREYVSESSPYDLDGTNSVSIRPMWHFDAGKMNGVDTSGNPADGANMPDWLPVHTESKGEKFPAVATSISPTWHDGTASAPTGFGSQPYLYFDGGDEIAFLNRVTAMGGWNVMVIGQAETLTSHYAGYIPHVHAEATTAGPYDPYGGAGIWAGRYSDVMQFWASTPAGYNLAANAGKPSWFASNGYFSGIEMISFEQNPIGHANGGGLLYFNGNNPCATRTSATRKFPFHFACWGGMAHAYPCKGYVFEMILFTNEGNSRAGDAPLTTADKNAWNAYARAKYGFGSGASGVGIVDF